MDVDDTTATGRAARELSDDGHLAHLKQIHDELRGIERGDLIARAARAGITLVPDPTVEGAHCLVYTPPNQDWPLIHILQMMFNWRLAEWDGVFGYARHWCFQGRSPLSFDRAIAALAEWQGNPAAEPAGWIKTWDGRRPPSDKPERTPAGPIKVTIMMGLRPGGG